MERSEKATAVRQKSRYEAARRVLIFWTLFIGIGAVGGALGVVAMRVMPDFPATDYITAVAVGIVSGLAATGVNQIGKQLGK